MFFWGAFCLKAATDPAQNRLERGKETMDFDEKIKFFQQAIAIDSSLVEAYVKLGQAFFHVEKFTQAHKILRVALNRTTQTPAYKTQILIELASIERKKRQYEQAVAYLLQAKQNAADNNQQGLIYYELGTVYMFLAQFEAAAKVLEQGQYILPEMSKKFQNALALALSEGKIEIWYRKANRQVTAKKWHPALVLFEKIADISPDYKDTQSRLIEIRRHLTEKIQETNLDEIYALAITQLLKKDYSRAAVAFQRIVDVAPQYKDVVEKLKIAQAKLAPFAQKMMYQHYYDLVVEAMREKKWVNAILYCELILAENPNYRDIPALRKKAERFLRLEDENWIEDSLYFNEATSFFENPQALTDSAAGIRAFIQQGMAAMRDNRWNDAVFALEEALALGAAPDSLKRQLTFVRSQLQQAENQQFDTAEVKIVQGRAWNFYKLTLLLLTLGTVLAVLVFGWKFYQARQKDFY